MIDFKSESETGKTEHIRKRLHTLIHHVFVPFKYSNTGSLILAHAAFPHCLLAHAKQRYLGSAPLQICSSFSCKGTHP
ncbi:Polyribonucleotide nucleotidyltransferase [Labeo rohita]|uniref:Polyribonucleotide nucleotidyltransferase n=1 Tax=Labeo rohita TaxID=84645 RepID=A0ABQ8KZ90_LABRO|nr:Polyribonucleotide nucleotidyltransferase [Labeo rohita]